MFGQNINITIYLIDLFKHCYHPGIKCKIKLDVLSVINVEIHVDKNVIALF
jgi:hypothetical protein